MFSLPVAVVLQFAGFSVERSFALGGVSVWERALARASRARRSIGSCSASVAGCACGSSRPGSAGNTLIASCTGVALHTLRASWPSRAIRPSSASGTRR